MTTTLFQSKFKKIKALICTIILAHSVPFTFGQLKAEVGSFATEVRNLPYLSLSGGLVCVASPIDSNKAVVAGHCLSKFSVAEDYRLSLGEEEYEITAIEPLGNDLTILSTNGVFQRYYEIAEPDYFFPALAALPSKGFRTENAAIVPVEAGGRAYYGRHGFSTRPGDSGTPLFQAGRIVGFHVGSSRNREEGGYFAILRPDLVSNLEGRESYDGELPPLIATAIAWCTTNASLCGSLVQGGATVLGAAVGGYLAYLATLNPAEKAYIEGQLNQCLADRDKIINELVSASNSQRGQGVNRGTFESASPRQPQDPLPDGVSVIDLRIPPSGQTRCQWDGPTLRCVYTPEALSSLSREFLFLARLAFLHRFWNVYLRWPTASEIDRVKSSLLSSSLEDAVRRAGAGSGISVLPPQCFGRGCVEP